MTLSLFGLLPTVLAHHPFGMEEVSLSPIQGFLSGVGHPLLGPDHFLFLVALMLVGWDQPRRWIPTLLAVGLLGSALAQIVTIQRPWWCPPKRWSRCHWWWRVW